MCFRSLLKPCLRNIKINAVYEHNIINELFVVFCRIIITGLKKNIRNIVIKRIKSAVKNEYYFSCFDKVNKLLRCKYHSKNLQRYDTILKCFNWL